MSHIIYVTDAGKGFKVKVILSQDRGHTPGRGINSPKLVLYNVKTPEKVKLFIVNDVIEPYRPKNQHLEGMTVSLWNHLTLLFKQNA